MRAIPFKTHSLMVSETQRKAKEAMRGCDFKITKELAEKPGKFATIRGESVITTTGKVNYDVKYLYDGGSTFSIVNIPTDILLKMVAVKEAIESWQNGKADFPVDLVREW